MKKWVMMLFVAGLVMGCEKPKKDVLEEYVELCRDVAKMEEPVSEGLTTWERKAEYKVVFADKKYLSFRAEEYEYNGGAHGSTKITVGTIERATGWRLKLEDIVSAARRAEVLKELRAKAIKQLGGEKNLQSEVPIPDNFYIAADGVHFVFNEYEIASYASGAIEVVLP